MSRRIDDRDRRDTMISKVSFCLRSKDTDWWLKAEGNKRFGKVTYATACPEEELDGRRTTKHQGQIINFHNTVHVHERKALEIIQLRIGTVPRTQAKRVFWGAAVR
jgi:hypothetical protein